MHHSSVTVDITLDTIMSVSEDCIDPTCSNHGSCVLGKCYCKAGWQGVNCSLLDQQVYQCLPGCSEHGTYDLEMGSCVCEEFWSGSDCSQGKKFELNRFMKGI